MPLPMQPDELEFSICQYLDGHLAADERTALEARLTADPAAQALLADHRRLHAALKAMPLPSVRWNALTLSISTAVDVAQEEQTARSYRMPFWVRLAVPLSLAALVTIAVGVGFQILNDSHAPTNVATVTSHYHPPTSHQMEVAMAPESSVIVIGPQPETIIGPVEEQVTIGPSPAVKDQPTVVQYSEDVVSRPSSVTIASGVVPVHDAGEGRQLDME